MSKSLGTQWNLHTPHLPPSSSKVERADILFKTPLTKLSLHKDWISLLQIALLRIHATPGGLQDAVLFSFYTDAHFCLGQTLALSSVQLETLPLLQQAKKYGMLSSPHIHHYDDNWVADWFWLKI